jgi:hypothetical protein
VVESPVVVPTAGLGCSVDLVDWSLKEVEDLIAFHN